MIAAAAVACAFALVSAFLAWLLVEERRRTRDLVQQLLTMRREGFAAPFKATVNQPPPEPEQVGLKRAEKVFIDRAVADLQRRRPDLSPRELEAEARRLRESVIMQDVPS